MLDVLYFAVVWVALTVRLYIAVPWLYLNQWLSQMLQAFTVKPMHHVLVVGDGLAEGVGDWTTAFMASGLSKHLSSALSRATSVRHRWGVASFGYWQATSGEWTPKSTALSKSCSVLGCLRSRTHFQSCVASPWFASSSVVILCLGSMDSSRRLWVSPKMTGINVAQVAKGLCEHGCGSLRPVIVVGLPANAPDAEERNASIAASLAAGGERRSLPIVFCPFPGPVTEDMVCFDGMHPSSVGYRALADELARLMEPMLLSVEADTASGEASRGHVESAARAVEGARKRLARESKVREGTEAMRVLLGER
jgi:hypothetical protein